MPVKFAAILALICLLAGCGSSGTATLYPPQTDCWSKKQIGTGAEIVVHGDAGKLTALLESSVAADALDKQRFKLKDSANAKAVETSNVYVQSGSGSYDIHQAPVTLPVGMEVIAQQGVTPTDGKIPANTKVSIEGANFAGVMLRSQPKLTPTTQFSTDDLRPQLLPSATPPGTIKARAFKVGAGFQTSKSSLDACMLLEDKWQHVSIEKVDATPDYADLTIALPASTQWNFHHPVLAVMLGDGSYGAQGGFYVIPIGLGAVVALLVLVAGHIFFWWLAIKGPKGDAVDAPGDKPRGWLPRWQPGKFARTWFGGADGLPSLSLFQIYLWTWVVLVGLTYVVTITGELFAITPQVLTLLGIAGVGSLAARFVAGGNVQRAKSADTARFSDILKTDGRFDLYRLQMFLFTVYTAAFVAVHIAIDQSFPVLESSLLLLMGISNGIYVGSKVAAGDSPFQTAERLDIQLKVLKEAKTNADNELARLSAEKAAIEEKLKADPNDDNAKTEQGLNATRLAQAKQKSEDLQKQIDDTAAARKAAVDSLSK